MRASYKLQLCPASRPSETLFSGSDLPTCVLPPPCSRRHIQFRPQEGCVVLQPLPSVRVVDQVRQSLRSAIMTGELPPGTRLSVPDLRGG